MCGLADSYVSEEHDAPVFMVKELAARYRLHGVTFQKAVICIVI
jgi:hypothetical protein